MTYAGPCPYCGSTETDMLLHIAAYCIDCGKKWSVKKSKTRPSS